MKESTLPRTLGLFEGVGITFAIMVGTGIFSSPGSVLGSVNGSVGMALFVWVYSGILCLLGGLCFGELGASIPSSGGAYQYLNIGLHPIAGFMLVWAGFLCLRTGGIAVISIIFARYLGSILFSLDSNYLEIDADYRIKALAISAIVILSILNLLSIKWSIRLIKAFVIFKFLAILYVLILSIRGIYYFGLEVAKQNFSNVFEGEVPWTLTETLSSLGVATIFALWAYEGFSQLNMVAEEVKNPGKNIPLSIVIAVLGVTFTFLIVNVAYLCVMPAHQVVISQTIAIDLARIVAGHWGEIFMSILISLSALGSLNGGILTSPRILFAAARDDMFPFARIFRRVSVNEVPYNAVILQGVASSMMVIPGNFNTLVRYFGFTAWIFYALVIIALIRLRYMHLDIQRPFKVRPFPFIPLIFIIVSLFIVATMFLGKPVGSFLALLVLLSGAPVYFLFFAGNHKMIHLNHI